MLNRYPLWKYLFVLFLVVMGGVYALPNLYPDDPALQISGASSATVTDRALLNRVTQALDKAGIAYTNTELTEKNALIRFADDDAQLKAKAVAKHAVGDDYLVALNLAPTTPEWLVNLGASPMKLGLDLRGGVHFLMEVDMAKAIEQRLEIYISEVKNLLREEKLRYRLVEMQEGHISIKFETASVRDQAVDVLRDEYKEFQFSEEQSEDGYFIKLALLESKLREIEDYAIKQNLTTLRNRVNELGVAEPLVQRQGSNRIVVELPGIQDTALAKRIIGATANLEFRLEAKPDELSSRTEEFEFRDKSKGVRTAVVEKGIIITGSSVANAGASFDDNGQPQVNITLDAKGGKLMNRVTSNAVKRSMAVIFIEHKTRSRFKEVNGELIPERDKYVEKSIISLATIQTALGNRFRITGLDNPQESSELALLLRAGSLAAPIYFVEERTVGPSLGQENIDLGVKSVQIGMILVVLFMLLYYRAFGLYANIALGINLVLLVSVMSILSATLTLPGIAGIVLTVGMAVDANVLIFERIKEELKNGMPPQSAIHPGYERAFETIFDANITTLLVAVILFAVGTGPVKGFAVTLSIGILTSMYTAIVITRAMVNLTFGRRSIKKLWI
ncbi:MAG: protein translocase subunit SecD [Pseudomonadales bacterium]|nr:protein translocase subunit SecD [Pseudomonadales bacterium]